MTIRSVTLYLTVLTGDIVACYFFFAILSVVVQKRNSTLLMMAENKRKTYHFSFQPNDNDTWLWKEQFIFCGEIEERDTLRNKTRIFLCRSRWSPLEDSQPFSHKSIARVTLRAICVAQHRTVSCWLGGTFTFRYARPLCLTSIIFHKRRRRRWRSIHC